MFSRNHTATATESTSDTPTHAVVPLSGLRLRLSRVNKPILAVSHRQRVNDLHTGEGRVSAVVMPAPLFPAKSGVVGTGGVGLVSGRAAASQSVLLASRLTGLALLVVAGMLAFKDPTIYSTLLRTQPQAPPAQSPSRFDMREGSAATPQ